MAKKKVVTIVCDGCGNELREGPGVSAVTVDTIGSDTIRKLDLCPKCSGEMPEGTTRKRPAPRKEKEPASTAKK